MGVAIEKILFYGLPLVGIVIFVSGGLITLVRWLALSWGCHACFVTAVNVIDAPLIFRAINQVYNTPFILQNRRAPGGQGTAFLSILRSQ